MGFAKDKVIGSKAEIFVIETLEKAGLVCSKAKGKNEFWDIELELDGQLLYIEVKFDRMSTATGNLALEYFNPKKEKLSGISVTKCDFWVFVINEPMEIWITGIKSLKDYIGRNPPFKVINKGGDNNASLYLYKKDKLLPDIFWRIDNAGKELIQASLNNYVSQRNNKELCGNG